jgi:hypothetical protein
MPWNAPLGFDNDAQAHWLLVLIAFGQALQD